MSVRSVIKVPPLPVSSGGDDRRCVHGGVRAASPERQASRSRGSQHVISAAGAGENVQDPTSAQRPAAAQDRHPHG